MRRDLKLSHILLALLAISVALGQTRQARSDEVKPDFQKLTVKFEPPGLSSFGQTELLIFEPDGKCWYRAEDRPARANVPAQHGAVIGHTLSPDRIERINKLLNDAQWLTAKGGEGPATHTDAGTITLTLDRKDKQVSIECHGMRPEPYASLLGEFASLAIQERRIYLHDHISGKVGTDAWQEIGNELKALRGDPFQKSPYNIDYNRYLPIAKRIVRNFYGEQDEELVPAVQLVALLKAKSELPYLHRMAHDRSHHLREEIALVLGEIHDPASLPVLADMMSANFGGSKVGFVLSQWGDDAVPEIVKLIALSTDESLGEREHVTGEDMIRVYLDNWDKIKQPVDPPVIAAVQKALDRVNPQNGSIRTTYHHEFLQKTAAQSTNETKGN